MIKSHITKALLFSILFPGLLGILPVKSQDNTAEDYEQAIEEIDTILRQSNALRDKYSIPKARLSILENDKKIHLNDFDRIYISLYKNIHNTVKAIKSEESEEASPSIFNSKSSNLDNRICTEFNIECSSIINKLIGEIQPEIDYIIETTNELIELDEPQVIKNLVEEDKNLVQNPKLEEFRSLVGEELGPEAQKWVDESKKLIEESKELIEEPKELINDEKVEEKEKAVPKYNALLIRFNNIETNLVKINSELSKELGQLGNNGDPEADKDILYIVNLCLLAIIGGLLAWYFIRKSPQLFSSITESHSRELSNSIEQLKSILINNNNSIKQNITNSIESQNTLVKTKLEEQYIALVEQLEHNRESLISEAQVIFNKLQNTSRALEVGGDEKKLNDIEKDKDNQQPFSELVEKEHQEKEQEEIGILSLLKSPEVLYTLLNNYNQNPKYFISNFTKNKISASSESFEAKRSGKKPTIVFQEIKTGIYCIVDKPLLKENYYLLVPKDGLVINEKQYNTVKEVFECDNYENRSSNQFKLIYPAVVKTIDDNQWELIITGKLQFESF